LQLSPTPKITIELESVLRNATNNKNTQQKNPKQKTLTALEMLLSQMATQLTAVPCYNTMLLIL